MSINERIKDVRKSASLSQTDFSEHLGTTRGVITNLEGGKTTPNDPFIKLICREFNVDEHWLRTGEGEMFKDLDDAFFERIDRIMADENSLHKNLIRAAVNLDVEDLEAIERIINKIKDSFMDEEKKEES